MVYDWWCSFDEVCEISWEISLLNGRKSENEKAHVLSFSVYLYDGPIGVPYNERCHYVRGLKHGLFHSLICAHSTAIFPMKFHTHYRKVISNHKPHSEIVYYVTCRKCMPLNFQLIFIIYPYLVLIEAWRIDIFLKIRMESGEPPEDDYVRNLQRKHLI